MRIASMRWVPAIVVGSVTAAFGAPDDAERIRERVRFLSERDAAWRQVMPGRLRLTETSAAGSEPVRWSVVCWDGRVYAEKRRFPEGSNLVTIADEKAQLVVVTVGKDGRFLVVGKDPSGGTAAPWSGTIAAKHPDANWAQTVFARWTRPVEGQTVESLLAMHPAVALEDDGKGRVRLSIAVSKDVAQGLFDPNPTRVVSGFLGWIIDFEARVGWRPTRAVSCTEVNAKVKGDEGNVPRERFCGRDCIIDEEITWGEWTKVDQSMLPTLQTMHYYIAPGDDGQIVAVNSVSQERVRVETIASLPDEVELELEPPQWLGPVGRVLDAESGQVTRYDLRPLSDRRASMEVRVDAITKAAEEAVPEPLVERSSVVLRAAVACAAALGVLGLCVLLRGRGRGRR